MRGVHRDVTPQIQPRFFSTLLCGQASEKRVTKGQAHAFPGAGRRRRCSGRNTGPGSTGKRAASPATSGRGTRLNGYALVPAGQPLAGSWPFCRRLRGQSCSFCRKSLVECLGCRLPARPCMGLSDPKGLTRRAVRACLSRILHLFFTSSGIQAQPSFFAHALCTAPWGSLLPGSAPACSGVPLFVHKGRLPLSVHPKPVWDAKDLSSWIVSGMLFCSA